MSPSKSRCPMPKALVNAICLLLVLAPLHDLFFGGGPLKHSVSAGLRSNCPFKATSTFFTRHARSLTSLTLPSLTSLSMSSWATIQSSSWSVSVNPAPSHGRISTRLHSVATDNRMPAILPENQSKKSKASARPEALEVVVIGLSHHNAKVDVREKLSIHESEWNQASSALLEYESISEAAVLSTCNRFEIYLAGENPYMSIRDAMDFLIKRSGGSIDAASLRQHLFMLSGEDAIWHLMRVSAGLDSLVVGEGQILSQVRKAYEHSIEADGSGGKVVARVLNAAVSAGKRVRTETGIAKGAISISSAAVEFTAIKLGETGVLGLGGARVSVVGAGKMARLLMAHLGSHGVTQVTVINRSPARVEELAAEFKDISFSYEPMERMWSVVAQSDVVYTCTSSERPIITPEPLLESVDKRLERSPLFLVDISVPRNVHADCAEVKGVKSFNVDDLKLVVDQNTAKRKREIVEAEKILRDEQNKYQLWQQSLGAIPTIARLQQKAEILRQEELSKASKKLANLSASDLQAVDRFSKGIVAKLLHGPMIHLRQQTEADATRMAISQLQQAFQLE